MADFTVGFLLEGKWSHISLFSDLLFKLFWTHKKINVCAIQWKEFILNSEFVFKNAG